MNNLESRTVTKERFDLLFNRLVEVNTTFEKLNFDFLTKPEADSLVLLLHATIKNRERLVRRANSLPFIYEFKEDSVFSG